VKNDLDRHAQALLRILRDQPDAAAKLPEDLVAICLREAGRHTGAIGGRAKSPAKTKAARAAAKLRWKRERQ
jgi:hypothetical protein